MNTKHTTSGSNKLESMWDISILIGLLLFIGLISKMRVYMKKP